MDKQEEKQKVSVAENLLQQLIDENSLTLPEVQELSKKLQKVNSGAQKKKEENKKALMDFISNKIKIKEYLDQSESNSVILVKATQKILSKNQPNQKQEKGEIKTNQNSKSLYKVETQNLVEKMNKEGDKYFSENEDNLSVYFESLSNDKLESNEIPFYTMISYPKEKKANFFFKSKGKMNMRFSQVEYLCNPDNGIFLNVDYFSMIENCDIENGREYKKNVLDVEKVEKYIKELPLFKGYEIKIIDLKNDRNEFKKEFCHCCQELKEKIKGVVTNNKEFFNELFL